MPSRTHARTPVNYQPPSEGSRGQYDAFERAAYVLEHSLDPSHRAAGHAFRRSLARLPPATSPIRRLPDDLLAEIFAQHIAELLLWKPHEGSWWIVVSHVCRLWRDVALRRPRLWTWISASWPVELIRMVIARSGTLPLHVINFDDKAQKQQEHIFAQALRLQNLTLDSKRRFDQFVQAMHGHSTVPCLEELELNFYRGQQSFPGLSDIVMPALTSMNVFRASAASIRSLIRPTVTSLSLLIMPYQEEASLSDLMELLAGLPALRSLILSESYRLDKRHLAEARTVDLPHLERLEMSGTRTGFAELLEHLILPSTTRFMFWSYERSRDGDRSLGSAIRTYILVPACDASTPASAPRSALIKLHFSDGKEGSRKMSLTVRMWSSARSLDDLASSKPWQLKGATSDTKLALKMPLMESRLHDFIKELTSDVDLSGVSSMYISCVNQTLATADWKALLQAFPGIRNLALSNDAIHSFTEGTPVIDVPTSNAPSPSGPLYPSLEVLRIARVRWAKCFKHGIDTPTRAALISALQSLRREDGLALKRLEIADPENFTDRDRAVLVSEGVAQAVRMLDRGRISYTECGEDVKHSIESREDVKHRMWRIQHVSDPSDDSDESWGYAEDEDENNNNHGGV